MADTPRWRRRNQNAAGPKGERRAEGVFGSQMQQVDPNPQVVETAAVATLQSARDDFHRQAIAQRLLALRDGMPTNADSSSVTSVAVARALATSLTARLAVELTTTPLPDQSQGTVFALLVKDFVATTMNAIQSNRWLSVSGGSIEKYAQYSHLAEIRRLVRENEELRITLGGDYVIAPDVVVYREPMNDGDFSEILAGAAEGWAGSTFIRRRNNSLPIMQASVSCKWTLRSDRAQNARTEALNLLRLRKGRAPAIAVVTAEPLPSRLASLADGTGDVDRVYHFALNELQVAVGQVAQASQTVAAQRQKDDLGRMIKGRRLADISDLPFDLTI